MIDSNKKWSYWNGMLKESPQIRPHSDSNYLSEVASHQFRWHGHSRANNSSWTIWHQPKSTLMSTFRYDRVDRVDVAVPCRKTSCQPKAVQKCETKTRQECVTVSSKLLDKNNSFKTSSETSVKQRDGKSRFTSFGKGQQILWCKTILPLVDIRCAQRTREASILVWG